MALGDKKTAVPGTREQSERTIDGLAASIVGYRLEYRSSANVAEHHTERTRCQSRQARAKARLSASGVRVAGQVRLGDFRRRRCNHRAVLPQPIPIRIVNRHGAAVVLVRASWVDSSNPSNARDKDIRTGVPVAIQVLPIRSTLDGFRQTSSGHALAAGRAVHAKNPVRHSDPRTSTPSGRSVHGWARP